MNDLEREIKQDRGPKKQGLKKMIYTSMRTK